MKKDVFLWSLYDFANTPLTVAMGGLYLAQWVIIDNKFPDIWYGGIFTLSTVVLLLTSPFLGAWSDKVGRRMPFLKWTTAILILGGIAMGIVAVSSIARIPRVIIVLGLFFILQYSYQISLVFYNALLDTLSTSKTRGLVSGTGQAFGEIGWLLGSIMLLPFATGALTLFGERGRGQVFLPATLILIILGLPMILWLKERKPKAIEPKVNFRDIWHETLLGIQFLFRENKNVALFLIGFMFVSDALLTSSLYFAIFLDRVYKINDLQKVIAIVLLEIFSASSAYVIGRLGDKVGLKKLLILSCLNLTVVYASVALFSSTLLLYILSAFIGLGYGGFYAASRALLVRLSPPAKLGEYFGFYSTFQKFASIIGPLTWGVIILLLTNYGVVRYRIAILSLCVLMLVGTVLLTRVKEEKI